MKNTTQIIAVVLMSFVAFSCNEKKDVMKGKYQSGVLVINEGGFGSANGDVTFYNSAQDLNEQAIYKSVNGGFAGDVLQSMLVDGDQGYLVLNGSNKIEVVDNNTFKQLRTITQSKLDKPRYAQVINGKLYVSVWGAYNSSFQLIDSYVQVFDLNTLALVTTIDTDEGTEKLLYNGTYLFASNYNYGGSNTVNVINPSTNQSIKKITLDAGPGGMVMDANNKLWVIAEGSSKGKLYRINPTTFEIEKTIDLGVTPNIDLAISPDKQNLFYFSGKSVYKCNINASAASTAWVTESKIVNPYALGVNPATGDVYWSDALNFSSEGDVYVYDVAGQFKRTFKAGISPTEFVFK